MTYINYTRIIFSKDLFVICSMPWLSLQYWVSPFESVSSITTFFRGFLKVKTYKILYLSLIFKVIFDSSLLTEPNIHPPNPFSVAPKRILWAATPASHLQFLFYLLIAKYNNIGRWSLVFSRFSLILYICSSTNIRKY